MKEATAWQTALDRFTDGYGAPPALTDERTDRPVFLQMLEEVIREGIEAKLAASFVGAAERLNAISAHTSAVAR